MTCMYESNVELKILIFVAHAFVQFKFYILARCIVMLPGLFFAQVSIP